MVLLFILFLSYFHYCLHFIRFLLSFYPLILSSCFSIQYVLKNGQILLFLFLRNFHCIFDHFILFIILYLLYYFTFYTHNLINHLKYHYILWSIVGNLINLQIKNEDYQICSFSLFSNGFFCVFDNLIYFLLMVIGEKMKEKNLGGEFK